MLLTIVKPDDIVLIDGEARRVNCSSVAPDISVIQWLDTTGWIEFDNQPGNQFRLNEDIDSIEPWQHLIDAWYAAGPP
jgi:hypothetical protein